MLAWLRLARVSVRTQREAAELLRRWDLSVPQLDAIAHIGAAEGIAQGELAGQLLVTAGNVTQLLARLEARGLIARCPRGRTKRLFLTEEGRRLFGEAVPALEDLHDRQLSALSPGELRTLLGLLGKLDRALRGT